MKSIKEIKDIIANAIRSFYLIGNFPDLSELLKPSHVPTPEFGQLVFKNCGNGGKDLVIPILENHNPNGYMKGYPVSETKIKKYGINQCVHDVILMNRLAIPYGFAGGAWGHFTIDEKRGKVTIRKWLPHFTMGKIDTVFALSDRTKFKWDEEPV